MSKQGAENYYHKDRDRGGYRGGRGGRRGRGRRGGHNDHRGSRHNDQYQETASNDERQRRDHTYSGPSPHWSSETLKTLSTSSTQTIIERVRNDQNAFISAYKFNGNFTDYKLRWLIDILYGLTNASNPEDIAFASRILSQVFTDCHSFLTKLYEYIVKSDSSAHLNPLIKIGIFCINNVPQSTVFAFPQAQLRDAILFLPGEEAFKAIFEEYDQNFKECRADILSKERQIRHNKDTSINVEVNPHDLPPPNNFRDIEILPQPNEIQDVKEKPFLRPNLIQGSYHDWDHYLDVHFRLLREDFMGPLREGIHSYLQGTQRNVSVQLYPGVRILAPVCIYSGIGFLIQFDVSRFSRVRWEHSRRLIYGSLLCLSNDNFSNVHFASVVKRDTDSLKQGQIVVKFEDNFNAFSVDPLAKYEMVESSAYFEAYRHVLCSLQSIKPEQMPFHPYIVGGHCTGATIPLPPYLRGNPYLDLNSVLQPKKARPNTDVRKIEQMSLSNTCFDNSQLKALQMALSQEISVIQGPPGTGKTYIGLKIVEALLQNRTMWSPRVNCPILVVCYTNHALDQFLEGILDFSQKVQGRDDSVKVVRVGGRCKNENIKKCAMANLVSKMKTDRKIPTHLYKKFGQTRSIMKGQQEVIEKALKAIDAKEGQMLTIEELKLSMSEIHYHQLISETHDQVLPEKIIEYWLQLWFIASPSQPMNNQEELEDEELAAAIEQSLQMEGRNDSPPLEGGLIIEDDFIEVADEPQLVEEDRILEGETIMETPLISNNQPKTTKKKPKMTQGEDGWNVIQLDSGKRKELIRKGMLNKPFNATKANRIQDVWDVTDLKERWRLYNYWLNSYIRDSKTRLKSSADGYDFYAKQCHEMDQEVNSLVLRDANVVGVTTTGAAKHSYIFKNINPKIVIVEEAAEVLESHIITSLCSSVQQLILIGDHKQLQPKITHYELEKVYNMHISLFERLANILPIATLAVQHRMRPEIASIVGNHIYDNLQNHESVLQYDSIKGVGKNLFFIEHSSPEKGNPTGDVRSHANHYEAQYVVSLTRYLLKQGYNRSQITILTMYRGQLFEIRQNMRKDEFDGVRVAAVDDFQGEENDIIIISLVRSNSDGRIGFLKVENRVCVSLSRAKKGMFVIGNFSMLRDKVTTKWPAILGQLDSEGCIGDGLPLYCQMHPEEKLVAKKPEDFSKCPEGGCQKQCNYRLECGHVCRSPCHPIDREHKLIYKCQQKCSKELPCGHTCSKKCFQCTDGCGTCQVNVSKQLPQCGHMIRMKCSDDIFTIKCTNKCSKFLTCGHRCSKKCQEPCTSDCVERVNTNLKCGHKVAVPCKLINTNFKCPDPCSKILECDHPCTGTCGTCYRGRLHVACTRKCNRPLACNHLCSFPCTPECPPCTEKCNNYCYHSRCPKLCYEPCPPCREPCQWNCKHHKCKAKCGEFCDRLKCDEPCDKILPCHHPCVGLCGEDCPPCGVCDEDTIREIFLGSEEDEDARFIQLKDCGHTFEVNDLDYWMEQKKQEESQIIKFIECPKCKTPIRRSLRYGNIIKETIADIEKVKMKVLENGVFNVSNLKDLVESVISSTSRFHELHSLATQVLEKINQAISVTRRGLPPLFPHQVNTIENIMSILPNIGRVMECLHSLPSVIQFEETVVIVNKSELLYEVSCLVQFLTVGDRMYLTIPQISSATCEVQRLWCLSQLCHMQSIIVREKKVLKINDRSELNDYVITLVSPKCQITNEKKQEMEAFVKRLQHAYSIGGLSKQEMEIIVKAMHDIRRGAWYKCPKGHYYAIGDCGGANQESTCPECGSTIGGTRHDLAAGNMHAGEFDGSGHSAWSEEANLANYDPRQLFQ